MQPLRASAARANSAMAHDDGGMEGGGGGDMPASIICLAFRNTGSCRYGERCRFKHEPGEPIAALPSWHVADLPAGATANDVSLAFHAAMPLQHAAGATPAARACGYDTVLHARGGNAGSPYAHVTAASVGSEHGQDAAILADGISICGTLCVVKRRRDSKRERLADEGRRMYACCVCVCVWVVCVYVCVCVCVCVCIAKCPLNTATRELPVNPFKRTCAYDSCACMFMHICTFVHP